MRFLCRTPRKSVSLSRRPAPWMGGINHVVGASISSMGSLRQLEQQQRLRQQQQRQEMSATSSSEVRHDQVANKFTLDLGNNRVARIEYRPIGRNKIEMYHTEVPEELRGQGIGRKLAKGALELLASEAGNGAEPKRVKLTCSYLICHLDKFADERLKKLIVVEGK